MFGVTENEAKALSNEYNFGPLESTNNRTNLQRNHNSGNDLHEEQEIKEEVSEAFTVKDTEDNMINCAAYYNLNNIEPGTPPKSSSSGNSKKGNKKPENKLSSMMATLGIKTESKLVTDEDQTRVSLERRWKRALVEKERLDELERRLDEAEEQNRGLGHEPNFPPKFLFIKPLVYYSMDQVPDSRKRLVSVAYWNWIALIILLIANAVVAITVQYASLKSDKANKIDKTLNMVFALVSLLGIPLSFFVWFWPVYQSCSTGTPSKYHMAFFGLTIAFAHALLEFFGPLNLGMCGIFLAVYVSETRSQGYAIPVIILLFLWLFESIVFLFIIVKVFIFYRKDLHARRIVSRQVRRVVGI